MDLEKIVENLPDAPGVYLMKDKRDAVIYIGKAKNLKNRVRSYFLPRGDLNYKSQFLLSRVVDIDYLATDTEKEALILENTLIKRHRPKYNIRLRDDKTYVNLKLDIKHPFPRISIVRRPRRDGSLIFGPYSSVHAVRETLGLVNKLFPLRTCTDSMLKNRSRACLQYQIKRCLAPCLNLVDKQTYRELVKEVILFLEGKSRELTGLLKEKMRKASEALDFEEAARIRDQLQSIETTLEKQKVVSTKGRDQDIFAYFRQGGLMEIHTLFVRQGQLIGSSSYHFIEPKLTEEEVFSSFIKQFYHQERFIPEETILPIKIDDSRLIEELLQEKKGEKIRIIVPQRGERLKLLELARQNAEFALKGSQDYEHSREKSLIELKSQLGLRNLPGWIECFDISNIAGSQAVGSMVVFEGGVPRKDRYRHYRIKELAQVDDYGMMKEVLSRRYREAEGKEIPDMLIVDGGKGQLNIALSVLQELKLEGLNVISLAKKSKDEPRVASHLRNRLKSKGDEKIYLPGKKNPTVLPKDSPALLLLQRIRDEAHRFAITYHRKLRDKKRLRSSLEDIPGVGEVRKKELLRHFGSLKKIKEASLKDLEQAPGIIKGLARNIYDFLHPPPLTPPTRGGE
ncbi:MAG: excinuclease ABC subunit UvrC [Deltaproteobacteria bacterium]|nr:MAG: excinuclease ABC subunit UvrC [Deltaproteobacteria bacterium]